jgi:hypothetical protein
MRERRADSEPSEPAEVVLGPGEAGVGMGLPSAPIATAAAAGAELAAEPAGLGGGNADSDDCLDMLNDEYLLRA